MSANVHRFWAAAWFALFLAGTLLGKPTHECLMIYALVLAHMVAADILGALGK